ncbi:MAG: NCS2 family permease [Candidatus Tectomicrobia bacterium]|nr:NCS2 family permease [Candidatus Tectomicrobia bacterium]
MFSIGVPFQSAVVATCLVAGLLTIAMGLWTNYPLALAPGMGLNAVVAFGIVLSMKQSWQVAMEMIFIEGVIVTIAVLTNLREAVMNAIPKSLKLSIGVAIGMFIAFIGLSEGGIVKAHPATLVQLGNFTQPYTQVALIGLAMTAVLVARNIRGGILLGIFLTALVAIPFRVMSFPRAIISLPNDFSGFFQIDLSGALSLADRPRPQDRAAVR